MGENVTNLQSESPIPSMKILSYIGRVPHSERFVRRVGSFPSLSFPSFSSAFAFLCASVPSALKPLPFQLKPSTPSPPAPAGCPTLSALCEGWGLFLLSLLPLLSSVLSALKLLPFQFKPSTPSPPPARLPHPLALRTEGLALNEVERPPLRVRSLTSVAQSLLTVRLTLRVFMGLL